MIINSYRYGGGGASVTYLDSLAVTPRAVLSLRKMISTATVAIRVRRSNDNAEQDIGFSGAGLDTGSLASFVGSNNAFVTKVYDQTGNGEDAVQATAANQPRIVNAGTYDGKLVFDGSNDSLKITSLTQGTQQAGIYAKLKQAKSTSLKMMAELSTDGQATAGGFNWYMNSDNASMVLSAGNNSGGRVSIYGHLNMTALTQATVLFDRSLTGTAEMAMWLAGTSLLAAPTSNNEQTGNFVTNDVYIGGRAGSSLFADMWLETMVFYNADTASIRTSIEAAVA